MERKHNHYFKHCPYDYVDVYRVLDLFEVTDSCLHHAIKKLLVAGGRGVKDVNKDIQEAIDTLTRKLEMGKEESELIVKEKSITDEISNIYIYKINGIKYYHNKNEIKVEDLRYIGNYFKYDKLYMKDIGLLDDEQYFYLEGDDESLEFYDYDITINGDYK